MDAYIHNIDPFALHFWGDFGIRWYGLAYLGGFVVGYLTILFMAKRGTIQLKPEQVADFVTWVAIGTLVGGRVGYAVFYAPELLFEFSSQFPFWGVFAVQNGGMASHGGILGIMLATYLFGRKYKMTYLHLMDLTVLGGSIGIFFGRMANFINGELYGRAVESSVPWATKFPQELYLWSSQSVSKLFDVGPAAVALGEVEVNKPSLGFFQDAILHIKSWFADVNFPSGEMLKITPDAWQGWVSNYKFDTGSFNAVNRVIEAIITATQNGNQAVIEALAPVLTARHPSQIYQGLMEGLAIFLILLFVWRKPQRPGVISLWFGGCYIVARIIGEEFRMPDAHLGFQALGLTRGQWISIGFIALAVVIYFFSRRHKNKLGGWALSE